MSEGTYWTYRSTAKTVLFTGVENQPMKVLNSALDSDYLPNVICLDCAWPGPMGLGPTTRGLLVSSPPRSGSRRGSRLPYSRWDDAALNNPLHQGFFWVTLSLVLVHQGQGSLLSTFCWSLSKHIQLLEDPRLDPDGCFRKDFLSFPFWVSSVLTADFHTCLTSISE